MEEEILEILRQINPLEDVDISVKLLEDFLDSMSLLLLINELEEQYGIEIPLDIIKMEDFDNVCAIANLVNELISMKRK